MTSRDTSIRLIDVADAPSISAHLARDAKDFARWDPAQPEDFYTGPGQVRRIEQLLAGYHTGNRWPGVIVTNDEIIGQVTVGTIFRNPFHKGFVGYWVATPFQGQGHASRALGLMLQVMTEELGLYRAEAHTQLENLASQRVLRNNGFAPWGVAHSHSYINGAWRDAIFWERRLADGAPPS